MKVLVISDTHGDIDRVLEILSKDKYNYLIHLGDNYMDLEEIITNFNIEAIGVVGNCDYMIEGVKDELVLEILDKKIFICHGHNYNVKFNYNKLFYRSKELNVDLTLFGHSHKQDIIDFDGVRLVNPGSVNYPRMGSRAGYGVLTFDNKGNLSIDLKTF